MNFKKFIGMTKECNKGDKIWLKNETFNHMIKIADSVRLNEDGLMELTFTNKEGTTKIYISLKNTYISFYAEVKGVKLFDKYSNLVKAEIFTAPEQNLEDVFNNIL